MRGGLRSQNRYPVKGSEIKAHTSDAKRRESLHNPPRHPPQATWP